MKQQKKCFTISTYWAEKCHGSPANIEQALCFYRCARIYLYAFLWMQRPLIATHWISVHYARGKAILMSLLRSFAWSTHSEYFTLVCVCAFFFPFFKIHWHFEFWACVCYLLFEMFSENCFSSTLGRYEIPKCNQEAESMHSPAHFTTYLSFDQRQPANCSYVLFLFVLNSINFFFDYGAGIPFQWGFHQNSFNVPIGATSSTICGFFSFSFGTRCLWNKISSEKENKSLACRW